MKKILAASLMLLTLGGCGENYPTLTSKEKYICSQCHGLPMADKHTPAEWPAVIDRMIGYMQANGKSTPNAAERDEIINFYQKRSAL